MPQPVTPFPAREIAARAAQWLRAEAGAVLRAVFLPGVLYVAAAMAAANIAYRAAQGSTEAEGYLALVPAVQLAILLVCSGVASGAIYRLMFRGERPGWLGFRLGAEELQLATLNLIVSILCGLAMAAGSLAAAFPAGAAGAVLGLPPSMALLLSLIGGGIAVAYLYARLLLAGPVVMVTQQLGLGVSWATTRPHGGRLAFAVIGFMGPAALALGYFSMRPFLAVWTTAMASGAERPLTEAEMMRIINEATVFGYPFDTLATTLLSLVLLVLGTVLSGVAHVMFVQAARSASAPSAPPPSSPGPANEP